MRPNLFSRFYPFKLPISSFFHISHQFCLIASLCFNELCLKLFDIRNKLDDLMLRSIIDWFDSLQLSPRSAWHQIGNYGSRTTVLACIYLRRDGRLVASGHFAPDHQTPVSCRYFRFFTLYYLLIYRLFF